MKKTHLIVLLLILYSCSVKKTDYYIINSILKTENNITPFILNYKNDSSVIDIYLEQYKNDLNLISKNKSHYSLLLNYSFIKGYDWCLTEKDIEQMKKEFAVQENIIWETKLINNDSIELKLPLKNPSKKIKNNYISISRPLYNNTKNKAVIFYFEQKNNGLRYYLGIFKRENKSWKMVGKMKHQLLSVM